MPRVNRKSSSNEVEILLAFSILPWVKVPEQATKIFFEVKKHLKKPKKNFVACSGTFTHGSIEKASC